MANELNNNKVDKEQPLHATNHYLYYPDEKNIPPYLAYGFRPVFLLLAPYMVISMILWGLVWSGVLAIWNINSWCYGIFNNRNTRTFSRNGSFCRT